MYVCVYCVFVHYKMNSVDSLLTYPLTKRSVAEKIEVKRLGWPIAKSVARDDIACTGVIFVRPRSNICILIITIFRSDGKILTTKI